MDVLFKAVMVVGSAQSHSGHPRGQARLTALEHVANRPILHHVLDDLSQAPVDGLIVAGEADALLDVRACLRDYEPELDAIEYVVCRDGVDFASTLTAIAPAVGDSPCVIQPADGLLDEGLPPLAELLGAGSPDLVLFVAPDDPEAGDGAEAGDGHGAREPYQGPDGYGGPGATEAAEPAAVAGAVAARNGHRGADVGVFAPGALGRASESLRRNGRGSLMATGKRLAADGATVRLHPVEGWRRYSGNGRELLELNRVALDRVATDVPAAISRTNRLEGRLLIHPTANVRASAIIGPTVIGPLATVTEAYIGPYTSIGAGARIEGAEIERSIVFPGASVMHVGGRLVSSIVGRDARVFRDFSLPRALRLWVGDGDEVSLC